MLITLDNFVEDEKLAYYSVARRPYYILRGKKITKEQAFDIIVRENSNLELYKNFNNDTFKNDDEYIFLNTGVSILKKPSFDWIDTFIDPMGNVGENSIAYKWPEKYEFLLENLQYAKKYPYLSYVIIYTNYDEFDYKWSISVPRPFITISLGKIKENFDYALHIHDGGAEVINKSKAFELYEMYMKEYSTEAIFCRNEYNEYVKPFVDKKYINKLCDTWKVSDKLRNEIILCNTINTNKNIKKFYKIYKNFNKTFNKDKSEIEATKLIIEMMEKVNEAVKNKDYDLKSINFKKTRDKCFKLFYDDEGCDKKLTCNKIKLRHYTKQDGILE